MRWRCRGATLWLAVLDHGRAGDRPRLSDLVLNAQRPRPDDDEAAVTATQVLVARLIEAGRWRDGDPDILIAPDVGYDTARLTVLLDGLPVEAPARLRSGPRPPPQPVRQGRRSSGGPASSSGAAIDG
ncbi:hypothetical protein [Nonomuraea pusilla]|uniref:hypothetical protein n=1 Tax=Nonomuraea pusilla TaxID=46177 RepID=UPI000ADC6490|nr:hypothetical protein [Nonomuraea pusilla]